MPGLRFDDKLPLELTTTWTVPPGRGLSASHYPGTSCLATIVLSLRDENHSPIEAPRIRLGLIGFNPREPDHPERTRSEGAADEGTYHVAVESNGSRSQLSAQAA
jgi:hypothetical protein